MTSPKTLRVGDFLSLGGIVYELSGLTGYTALLHDRQGRPVSMALGALMADDTLRVFDPKQRRRPLRPAYFETLPEHVRDRALWLERHVSEALDGVPIDAERSVTPKPEFDPTTTSQRQRDVAKVAELEASGESMGLRVFQRFRHRYAESGVEALIDKRPVRRSTTTGRTDERYVQALRRVLAENTDASTGTVDRLMRLASKAVEAEHGKGVVPVPSRATFHRLLKRMAEARHATGSARTRRTLANQPEGPFGSVSASRPGEWMQIDSTPLDVAVRLDEDLTGRIELTLMIDLSTRSIAAAVLRPTTKAVDAALLLARSMTPEPMRPGWPEAISMAYSALPYQAMRSVDERLENAAARPVIAPENIVCDNGSVYMSATFLHACRTLGISRQHSHAFTPTDKGVVERTFASINTLFAQHVKGFLGSNVERRGKNADQDAVFSLVELQDLLDEWIVIGWQNRPHEGLQDPLNTARTLTPNEAYAAQLAIAGYVPMPLSAADYIELHPSVARTINSYGIKIARRVYDSEELNPLRGQKSGVKALKDLWEVRHDPYDITRVWVRNHETREWITAYWRQLRTLRAPLTGDMWRHARKAFSERDEATVEAITAEAERVLDDASTGRTAAFTPAKRRKSSQDKRAAAKAKAVAAAAPPDWEHSHGHQVRPFAEFAPEEDDEHLADVVPLPVFDAEKESAKWW